MSWRDYFRLLERYNGTLRRATRAELNEAAKNNPNTPAAARALAEHIYQKEQDKAQGVKDGMPQARISNSTLVLYKGPQTKIECVAEPRRVRIWRTIYPIGKRDIGERVELIAEIDCIEDLRRIALWFDDILSQRESQ